MTLFSDERIDFLADKFLKELSKRNLIKAQTPSFKFKTEVRKAYLKFYKLNEAVDDSVKKQIASMPKTHGETSHAYKVLYEKLFFDEWKKR